MAQHRLYGLRGNAYKQKYLQIYEQEKDAIAAEFNLVIETTGKFTIRDFGAIAVKFQLPLTAMDDFLNSATNSKFPIGTWDRAKDKGLKARDIGVVWN